MATAHESSEVDAAAVTALQQEVGYDAEFNVSHVADCQRSVCNDLISKHPFFIVKEGYSAIIDRLVARLAKRGVAVELRAELLEFGNTPADPPRVRARVRTHRATHAQGQRVSPRARALGLSGTLASHRRRQALARCASSARTSNTQLLAFSALLLSE